MGAFIGLKLDIKKALSFFDADSDGCVSAGELYTVLTRWLRVPGITAGDILDFVEAADLNKDNRVNYAEFMALLRPPRYDEWIDNDTTGASKKPKPDALFYMDTSTSKTKLAFKDDEGVHD